jgi:hypothetical protein
VSLISPHEGHTVEISGTIAVSGSGSAPAAQKLKVNSIRMLSARCPG